MERDNPTKQPTLLKKQPTSSKTRTPTLLRGIEKQKIVAIIGPTAMGKSTLAVALARYFNGEVISADSRQVYKGLDIGTGKITKREMRGVQHHLLDVVNPRKQFSVAEYQKIARKKISEVFSRGKLPIICGGTGFYIDALLNNRTLPEVPPNYALRKKLERKTATELFIMLKMIDSRRAKTIDTQNPRRLIRAIEIAKGAELTRKKKRGTDAEEETKTSIRPYNVFWVGLALPREELKKKIAIRLFARMRKGMVAEAKRLHRQGLSWKRMEKLGLEYRYLARYLQKKISKQEMIEKLKTEIWRYAKRQMTWFKRNKKIKWFNPSESRKIKRMAKRFLDPKGLSYV